ncbi:hypothetical protein CSX12_18300 [Microbacterium sp. Y-01]|nr:hypothetical protein CSX12_18300 [Microbacterium sp. Y-01]
MDSRHLFREHGFQCARSLLGYAREEIAHLGLHRTRVASRALLQCDDDIVTEIPDGHSCHGVLLIAER